MTTAALYPGHRLREGWGQATCPEALQGVVAALVALGWPTRDHVQEGASLLPTLSLSTEILGSYPSVGG